MIKISKKIATCVFLLIFAILFVVFVHLYFNPVEPKVAIASVYKTGPTLSDFSLNNDQGGIFTAASLRGHWTLLFFGYTRCPDICPMILGQLHDIWQTYKLTTPAPAKFVFVDISNQINNADEIKLFLKRFDQEFAGVYGTKNNLADLAKPLGVYYAQTGQRIDHSGQLFLINPQGKLIATFTPPFNNQDFMNDLASLTK